jgi:hypothetical protein
VRTMEVIQRRKVKIARKEWLLRRMPAQPIREVMMQKAAARMEAMGSASFPTRTTSDVEPREESKEGAC